MEWFPGTNKGVMNRILLIILAAVPVFPSCSRDPYKASFPEGREEIRIRRMDKDLFEMDLDSIRARIPWLRNRYGDFFELYNTRIINIGSSLDVTYPQYLTVFLTDYLNNEAYKSVETLYPDLSWLEGQLGEAFAHYHYFFPDRQIPAVYSFIAGFNQSIVVADSILAIGLDKYLGTDCEFYPRLGLQEYMIMNMHKDMILPDCINGWCSTEFMFPDSVDNVLSNMLYNGKILFLTKSLLPEVPDRLVAGFSGEQMQFCRANEARMWEFLVENKVLFRSDRLTIQKYTGIGPFTKEFGPSSPARAAVWIGWRIIEDYAARHPELSMKEIMEEDDFQKILTLARYDP